MREISPLGYTTIYTYDLASNRIAMEDATGAVTRYEYDANGNQVRQIDPLGQVRRMEYDDLNRMTRMVDELGAVMTMTYDAKGRVVTQTDARGQTTTTTYDEQGRKVRGVSPLGYTTVYTYNAMDSLIAMQDADGFVTTYEYDALDRQIVQRDPLGATRITTYDAAGQTDVEVDYRGNPTSYAFDEAGNTVAITNALSDTTATTYDRLDRITSTTDQLGRTSFTGYDALGRVISETTPLGFTTVFTYNEEGWLVAQSDALGQTRTTTYDAVGRPLTVTDEAGRTTTYEYDALGRNISETDALGRTMQMRYDAAGRVVQLIAPDGTSQSYTYDPLGNLLSETDANGNTTRYEYDAEGRRIRKTDALGHVWLYQYDQRGNQTAVELPSGTLITMTYDDLGRMVELVYDGTREVTFGYDANGNRTFMDDRSGRTSYTYDALNRLIASSDGNNRTAAYGYDAVGQRTSLTYPDGAVATYAYDADGRMAEVREPNSGASTTTYDALGRPTLMRQANGVTIAYDYDPVGNLLEQAHRAPDGAIQTQHRYALNTVNQRTQMIELLPQGTITTTYTYDVLDRLIRSVASDGRTTSYTLDNVGNRLLQTGTRQRAGITETYRIATDYNALNQLLRSGDSVLGESFYRYDSDGYRTAMFAPNRRDTYTYNAEGRMLEALVEVLDADTASWRVKGNTRERYTYDGFGRRVEREELNHSLNALRVRHEYRYDDGQIWDVLQSYRTSVSDEASERRYLYDTAFHKLATTEDDTTRYFQNDGLGSVTGATDSTGSLASADTMRYDDYGNLLGDESALPTEDAYTGYERDGYTGLHYARNRYYDSTTGTFLTPDPYPANYEDMLDLHRYLYVQANPINAVDLEGLFLIRAATLVTRAATLVKGTVSNFGRQIKSAYDRAKDFVREKQKQIREQLIREQERLRKKAQELKQRVKETLENRQKKSNQQRSSKTRGNRERNDATEISKAKSDCGKKPSKPPEVTLTIGFSSAEKQLFLEVTKSRSIKKDWAIPSKDGWSAKLPSWVPGLGGKGFKFLLAGGFSGEVKRTISFNYDGINKEIAAAYGSCVAIKGYGKAEVEIPLNGPLQFGLTGSLDGTVEICGSLVVLSTFQARIEPKISGSITGSLEGRIFVGGSIPGGTAEAGVRVSGKYEFISRLASFSSGPYAEWEIGWGWAKTQGDWSPAGFNGSTTIPLN
ncbi:MAG: hypothetical protein HC911_00395 [Chloroflexaceae bacterium]|nr:hypothetical protein [Chloroflexaceae bacterium]